MSFCFDDSFKDISSLHCRVWIRIKARVLLSMKGKVVAQCASRQLKDICTSIFFVDDFFSMTYFLSRALSRTDNRRKRQDNLHFNVKDRIPRDTNSLHLNDDSHGQFSQLDERKIIRIIIIPKYKRERWATVTKYVQNV